MKPEIITRKFKHLEKLECIVNLTMKLKKQTNKRAVVFTDHVEVSKTHHNSHIKYDTLGFKRLSCIFHLHAKKSIKLVARLQLRH